MKNFVQSRRFLSLSMAAVLLVCAFAAVAADIPPILGDWEGSLDTPNGGMPIVLHITRSKDGKFGGSIDSPDQGAMGLPITVLTLKGTDLHFEVGSVGGIFDGKVTKDQSGIGGQWKGVMGAMPLNLKRPAKR